MTKPGRPVRIRRGFEMRRIMPDGRIGRNRNLQLIVRPAIPDIRMTLPDLSKGPDLSRYHVINPPERHDISYRSLSTIWRFTSALKKFFDIIYHSIKEFFDIRSFPPPGMEMALAGAAAYMPESYVPIREFDRPLMMEGSPKDGAAKDFVISKEQLLKRLKAGNYTDTKIIEDALESLERLTPEQQHRALKIAYRMIKWGASSEAVTASLCLKGDVRHVAKRIKERVETVRHLDELEANWSNDDQSDKFRSMLFLMAKDVDNLLLLAAQDIVDLEHMTEIGAYKADNSAKKSRRAFTVTSWILKYLGFGEDGGNLEDLAFLSHAPGIYNVMERRIEEVIGMKRVESLTILRDIASDLNSLLNDASLPNRIKYRVKRTASTATKMDKKMRKKEKYAFEDVNGIRIILDTENLFDCFRAWEIIDAFFTERPDEIWALEKELNDDYIMKPKENGYQSLHIAYKNDKDYTVEIQIRTEAMDWEAEYGKAAHSSYKTGQVVNGSLSGSEPPGKQLFNMKNETMREAGVYFVFDENSGKIIKLVTGSANIAPTALDASFARDPEQAVKTTSIFVNGRHVSFGHTVNNGDTIRIVTGKRSLRNGMSHVKTPRAKLILFIDEAAVREKVTFNVNSLEAKGEKMFKKIEAGIQAEMTGDRWTTEIGFTLGTPKLSYSKERLVNRLGYESVTMLFCALAISQKKAEQERLKGRIENFLRENAILFAHKRNNGTIWLEVLSSSRRSVFRQLLNAFEENSLDIREMTNASVEMGDETNYFASFRLTRNNGSDEESFIRSLNKIVPHASHSDYRRSSSTVIVIKVKGNARTPSIAFNVIDEILKFGAGIRDSSIPSAQGKEDVEYRFDLQLPREQSKKAAERALKKRLGEIDGLNSRLIRFKK